MAFRNVYIWGNNMQEHGYDWLPTFAKLLRDWHIMDAGEVFVQLIAVILIYKAIFEAIKARRQADENNSEMLRRMRYAAIDELYFDINKVAIDHPFLRHPHKVPSDERDRYGTFALITYNFLETIYDTVTEVREAEKKKFEDVDLWETWSVIVAVEAKRHKNWLLSDNNTENFKPTFLEFLGSYIPELKQANLRAVA